MTKEDLAFIRALRNQGVEVTFSQPPQMQEGGRENYAVTDPKRILFDPSYTPSSEPKTFYDRLVDKGQSNSQLENLYEFFDITGISSYDDAAAAYDQWNRSGRTYPTVEEGVDMFGAVPVLGKLGRLKYLNPNTIKKSYKNIPWQEIVNKVDALQDMYEDDTTKDLPVSAVPELQGGEVEQTPIIYDYNQLEQFTKAQEAYLDSTAASNFSDFLYNPKTPYPLGYGILGDENIFEKNEDRVFISKKGKYFKDNYLSPDNSKQAETRERVERVEPSKVVGADWGYKTYPVWDAPKTRPYIKAKPVMEVEKRPATNIKMPGSNTMSKEDFIKRYGQKVWDEQDRTPQLQGGEVEASSDSLALKKYYDLQKELEGQQYVSTFPGWEEIKRRQDEFYKRQNLNHVGNILHRFGIAEGEPTEYYSRKKSMDSAELDRNDLILKAYGDSLIDSNPNFYWQNYGSSPDLAHKFIEPIGEYRGKAWNFIYPDPNPQPQTLEQQGFIDPRYIQQQQAQVEKEPKSNKTSTAPKSNKTSTALSKKPIEQIYSGVYLPDGTYVSEKDIDPEVFKKMRAKAKRAGFSEEFQKGLTPELQGGSIEGVPIDPETGKPFLAQDRPGKEIRKQRRSKAKNIAEARRLRKRQERLEEARSNENVQWLLYNIYKHESDKDAQGNINLGGFNLSAGDSSAFGSGQFIGETRNSILEKYGVDAWSANPIEQELASIALIDSNGLLGKVKRGQFKGNSLTKRVKVKDKKKPKGFKMDVQNWEAFVDDNAHRLIDKPKDSSEWLAELRKYRTGAVYKPSESFSKIDPKIQKKKADLFKKKYGGVWPTGESITKPDSLIDFTTPGDSSRYTLPPVRVTPELQEGLVETKTDNTAVNFVNPFLEQELYKQNQAIAAEELRRSKAENPGVIYETKLPSASEKALNVAANPVQAFGYSVRGEDMPPGLLPNADTNIDAVLDMVNPAAWLNYANEAKKSAKQGDVLGTGLNLLGAVPGIEIPGLTLGAKTLVKPVVDKIQPVVKAGLDDTIDMLTTGMSAMKRDFSSVNFDIKNKIGPEKISADNVSNKTLGAGYDRFDQTLGGRVSKSTIDNELFRTSARTLGQKYFDPSVIDLLEGLNRYDEVSRLAIMNHKLNLADLGQMRRFNTKPLNLTSGGEYTNFLNTQKLSPNFTASDELLVDFYTRGYDQFFNSPNNFISVEHIADFLNRNPAVRNPSQKDLDLLMEGFDRFHKDVGGRLESSVLKTKLNKPTSLFRLEGGDFPVTVRRDGNIYTTNYSDMQVGDVLLPDNRFKSTSYDKPAYFGSMGSVINAPAGQSVLVPNLTGVRNYTNELEAILPSQLELQVKQISDRLPYFERGKLKNMMLDKSYAFDILNPYKKGGVEKMQEGGMERQKFSKEDLSFMRALRDRGVEVTFSSEGYRDDSPDRNNSVNVIDTKGTGRISMNNNDGTPIQNTPRILAITDKGQRKILESGNEYKLDGNKVLEIPMMQGGGSEKKVSEYMDALSGMDQDSIINPRYPADTDVAMSRLEEMFPFLQYSNKDYSREEYQKAMQGVKHYLNAPMTDQKRIEREENTVAAKPLTSEELFKRDNTGYYRQPIKMDETGLRPETPNKYTAKQIQRDANMRNSGITVYQNGGPEVPLAQSGMVEAPTQSYLNDPNPGAYSNPSSIPVYEGYGTMNDSGEFEGITSDSIDMGSGSGFGMSDAMAIGAGISNISQSLAQLGPESSTEVGSVSGMGGSRERAVEGTIAGTMSSIPIVGQFYQIGAGIGSGFEAGANAFYEQGNETGGEAMTAMQGIFDPSSQWGRNAELWEAGYLSDGEAALNFVGGFFGFGGGPMMDRKVRDIKSNRFTAASARATGGLHTTPSPSAESAGKFSKATGYPKPKRT